MSDHRLSVAAAVLAARAAGCRCSPDVAVHAADHVTVRHDEWCPMLNGPTQFVGLLTEKLEREAS